MLPPDNFRFPPHMTATTWQQRLDLATDEEDVVDIARDFLAGFDPNEIYRLPQLCRPPTRLFAEDIGPYAFELVSHECSTPESAEYVHRLARFFSHAATRLAQLSALHQHADDGDIEEQLPA
jgi:hypothetical protein